MKQRVISVFLAIVMLVSIFPTTGYATNEGDTTEIDTGDVSIEGTNGFGALLSTELTKNQTEAAEGQSEYEAGYSVTALDIVGNTATVEYNSMETAVLLVAIYSEDWMQLLASGQVIVNSEETQAVVTIEGEMPEYFQAMAYLMDTYDLSPLCPAYTTPLYTQAMQELLASTVHDYEEDRVLNLDEDETTNFAVYSEDTIVIEEQVGVNTIVSADDETTTYVIQNADESITSLVVGDVFVYPYGDSDILIIKVASISISGTTVTIIGDNTLEMEEVFDAVKIEGESDTSDIIVDDSTADEGITYLGEEVDGDAGTYDWQGGNTMTVSKKFKFEEKIKESTEGGGVSVSVAASGTILLKLDVGVKYYLSLKTQYIEFKVTPKADFSVEIEAKIDLAKKIGYLFVSPCPGVYVGFEPELQAKFSGKLSTQLTIFMVIGFKYDNDSGIQNISTAPDLDLKVNVDGTIFLGLDFCPKIKILDDTVAFAEVNMLVGGEIKATTSGYMYEAYEKDAPSHHQCRECVAMDVSIIAKIGGTLKILNQDWLTVKINIGEFKFPLGEMYYSIDQDIFDSGSCPNLTYRVTVELRDAEGNPVPDWDVAVSTLDEPLTTNKNGVAVFYTRVGSILVKAERDGYYDSASINIQSAKKIKLQMMFEYDSSSGGGSDDENISWDDINLGGIIGDIDPGEIVDPGKLIDSGSCGDNLTWALYDSGLLKISGYGEMEDYWYANTPWYNYRSEITSLIIEDGVATIDDYAFEDCDSLTSVEIGDSVTTIGGSAFSSCDSLTSVEIGDSVTTIGDYAFGYCDSLTSVEIGDSVTTIGDSAFCDCNSLTSVEIGDSVTTIGDSAFYWCDSLTSVEIGDSVTTIGDYAFCGCYSLTSVEIGDSVTTIGDSAFCDCDSLTSVEIGDSVTTIGDSAFCDCDSLTSVEIGDSVTTIGDYAFEDCYNLTSVEIGDSVTTIGDYAFYGCDSLTSVEIGDSVTTIGDYAFCDCDSLMGIYVDEKNPNYSSDDRGVLFDKFQITLIQAPSCISGHYATPDSVTTIGDYAFYFCYSLTSVEIGDSVTTIGGSAFRFCYSLTDVYYSGTEQQWDEISIGYGNEDLLNASIHFNSTNSAHAVDETIGAISISESIVRNNPHDMDSAEPSAVYPGDYSTEITDNYTLKTASFTGLVPGQQYILLALKSLEADNPLSADNLLYIYQAEALEDGTLTFQYIQRESVEVSYVMACGASNKNLSDAQITFPEMTADGTLWTVNPTVVYDGKTLTEGKDYVITGVVDYTEAGEYICYIRGIYNYTGLVECHYTVEPSEPTSDILRGDVNGDGYVNSNDSIYLLRYTLSPDRYPINQSGDMNGDGYVNSNDAIYLLRHTLTPNRYPLA